MKTSLVFLLVVAASACGKSKSNEDKTQGAKPTTDDVKPTPEPTPPPKAPPKGPDLTDFAYDDWKIAMKAPAGTEVIDVSPGDKELKMPDNAKLKTQDACGWDIDISRHWKTDLASFYDSAKKDSLEAIKYMTDEKSDTGFKVYYTGNAPIGPMFGVQTGVVVGDRLVLCSAGMNRLTEEEAVCVNAVCTSIVAK